MKKLSFALACAASVSLFADGLSNTIGFEGYTAGFTGLSLKTDAGADEGVTSSHWFYKDASGSTDGSTVKAYGSGDNLTAPTVGGDPGKNYLELSTEGGTLWRSVNTLADSTNLGEAQTIGSDGIYVDTLVQFTPTEDGGTPDTEAADKLAIWLNVDTSGAAPVTNLMVRANYYDGELAPSATNYVLSGAVVEAGTWYRLTVKAIADVCVANEDGYHIPAFAVYLDGNPLAATDKTIHSDVVDGLVGEGIVTEDMGDLIKANRIIPSLQVGESSSSTLQAVGFKGSGAIDNLGITDSNPLPAPVADPEVKIGDTGYETLGQAFEAAGDGDVLTLQKGVTLTAGITAPANMALTLDLNGQTVSYSTATSSDYIFTVNDGSSLVVSNGTLTTTGRGVMVAGVFTFGDGVAMTSACRSINCVGVDGNWSVDGQADHPAIVTIAAGATVTHGQGDSVCAFVRGSSNSTRTYYQAKAILNVYGSLVDTYTGNEPYGITGNGGNATMAEVNFYDGSVYSFAHSSADQMMWLPQVDLNLYGGTLTSASQGIYIRCGKVNVPAESTVQVIANGADANALILDRSSTTYPRFQYPDLPVYETTEIDVSIAGGTFTSGGTAILSEATGSGKTALAAFVSGGYFSDAIVTDVVEEGYKAVASATKANYFEIGADVLTGTGTAADPWTIDSRRHLKAFRNGVNAGTYGTAGTYAVQTADIDLEGIQWTDIGTGLTADGLKAFNGTYDGGNHYVSNFVLSTRSYSGFFAATESATFKNLKLLDARSPAGAAAVSILVGDAEPNTANGQKVVIDNVTVSGTIEGVHNVGGFSAWLQGTVEILNSTNLANCTTHRAKVGGFSPYYGGATKNSDSIVFSNCCNKGTITMAKNISGDATYAVGGILAFAQNTAPVTFLDCVNEGAIVGTAEAAGVDKLGNLATTNFYGTAQLGGIMGVVSGSLAASFTNCVNAASVSANVAAAVSNNAAVAGILGGIANTNATISIAGAVVTTDTTLTATVAADRSSFVGAFVGINTAYNADTGAGVSLLGKAPTLYAAVGKDLTVGGYTATKTEGDYTVYYVQAASEWAEVEQGQIGEIPAADKDAVEDNLALIRTALSTNEAAAVGDWLTKVYGNTKVPAATIKDARNIGVSVKYDLPLMTNDTPTVEVADAEVTAASGNVAAFSFTIKDGTESVSVTAAQIQNMVQWTDSLSTPFAVSTSTQVQVTPAADGKSFKAELKPVAGKTSGFMKVVLEP